MLRNYKMPNERAEKELNYRFRHGTTAWKKEKVRSLIVEEEVRDVPPITATAAAQGGDAMDTS